MRKRNEWRKATIECIIIIYSVLARLPVKQIGLFQKLQNSAIRLVLKKRKRDYVTPLLSKLHLWNSVVSTRWQLLSTVTSTAHFPYTFQLCFARITHPPNLKQKAFKTSQTELEIFWSTLFQFDRSICVEFAACRSKKFYTLSESAKIFRLFRQAFSQT